MSAQLRGTAYHEAGHAVATWTLGVKLGTVTIDRDGDALGSATHGRILTRRDIDAFQFGSLDRFTGEANALRQSIIALAGIVAQRRYAPRSVRRWHGRGDRETFNLIADRVVGDDELERKHWYARALRRTERIINDRWPAVESLAHALLKKHTLLGSEALAVIYSVYELPEAEQRRLEKLFKDKG